VVPSQPQGGQGKHQFNTDADSESNQDFSNIDLLFDADTEHKDQPERYFPANPYQSFDEFMVVRNLSILDHPNRVTQGSKLIEVANALVHYRE
jgi:hypothetical protein